MVSSLHGWVISGKYRDLPANETLQLTGVGWSRWVERLGSCYPHLLVSRILGRPPAAELQR